MTNALNTLNAVRETAVQAGWPVATRVALNHAIRAQTFELESMSLEASQRKTLANAIANLLKKGSTAERLSQNRFLCGTCNGTNVYLYTDPDNYVVVHTEIGQH